MVHTHRYIDMGHEASSPVKAKQHEQQKARTITHILRPEDLPYLNLCPPSTYALLAAAAYSDDWSQAPGTAATPESSQSRPPPLPEGWELFMHCSEVQLDCEGYSGVAFLHRRLGRCVIAERGTVDLLGLRTGLWMMLNHISIQFYLAEQFSLAVRARLLETTTSPSNGAAAHPITYEVCYTGHSLGAALASHRAVEEGVAAVTFECPGMKDFLKQHRISRKRDGGQRGRGGHAAPAIAPDALLTNYLQAPNPINTLRGHVGVSMMLPMESDIDLSLTQVVKELQAGASLTSSPDTSAVSTPPPVEGATPSSARATLSRYMPRLRVPSMVWPQEYLRSAVFQMVGIREIQEYMTRLEPHLQELLSAARQHHSISTIATYFSQYDASCVEEPPREVVVWPSSVLMYMEYINILMKSKTAVEEKVRAAYESMLGQLYQVRPAEEIIAGGVARQQQKSRLATRHFSPASLKIIQLWCDVLTPAQKQSLELSMYDCGVLNTVSIAGGKDDSEEACVVVSGGLLSPLQVREFLFRLSHRKIIQQGMETISGLPSSKL